MIKDSNSNTDMELNTFNFLLLLWVFEIVPLNLLWICCAEILLSQSEFNESYYAMLSITVAFKISPLQNGTLIYVHN